MIKFLLDILQLVNNVIPLFFSIAVFATLAVVLAKSIKKHAKVYYWVLSIPFILTLVPFFLNMAGMDVPRLNGIPVLGYFMRDYIHMATLGFPLLIIIMYMGALDTRNKYVARLMSIRKELSIIVGFPVLTHATLRVFNTFPKGWKFFFAHEDYMAEEQVKSVLGAGISSFVFVLGIVMLALFLVLWITSFTPVRRRMGNVLWRRTQKWAYVLYAMLFVHSMGLQIGGLLNPKQRGGAKTELVAKTDRPGMPGNEGGKPMEKGGMPGKDGGMPMKDGGKPADGMPQRNGEGRPGNTDERPMPSGERPDNQGRPDRPDAGAANGPAKNGPDSKKESKGLADIEIDRNVKRYIHMASVVLIFGSYLYLRVRKARRSARKR